MVLLEKVAKRLIRQFLKSRKRVASQQIEAAPRLGIEFDELAPRRRAVAGGATAPLRGCAGRSRLSSC